MITSFNSPSNIGPIYLQASGPQTAATISDIENSKIYHKLNTTRTSMLKNQLQETSKPNDEDSRPLTTRNHEE
jgi:hypothetical protein